MVQMQLGEILPMALLDIRLRHLREKHDHLGEKAIEWLIKHLLDSLEESGPRLSDGKSGGLWPATEDNSFVWKDSLPKLAHLERLISDINAIIKSYTTKSWEAMHQDPTRYIGPVDRARLFPNLERQPLKLSTTERARLLEALICFDIYCNAFFYDGGVLFQGNWAFRRLICKSRTNPNKYLGTQQRMKNFYTMLNFILDRFALLLRTVDASLCNKSGLGNVTVTKGFFRFIDRSRKEHEAFLQYLCSKGYSMLLRLEDLKGETQREFVVAIFLRFCSLHRPPILLEESLDCLDYPSQWMPWLDSNWYNQMWGWWELETGFWDKERLDRLRERVESWVSRQRQFTSHSNWAGE